MLLVRHFPVARRSFHPFSTEAVGFFNSSALYRGGGIYHSSAF